jgi:hypothetical protein
MDRESLIKKRGMTLHEEVDDGTQDIKKGTTTWAGNGGDGCFTDLLLGPARV